MLSIGFPLSLMVYMSEQSKMSKESRGEIFPVVFVL